MLNINSNLGKFDVSAVANNTTIAPNRFWPPPPPPRAPAAPMPLLVQTLPTSQRPVSIGNSLTGPGASLRAVAGPASGNACAMHRYYQRKCNEAVPYGPVLSLQSLALTTIAQQPYEEVREAAKDMPISLHNLAVSAHAEHNPVAQWRADRPASQPPSPLNLRLEHIWARSYAKV
ncbi:MAG: hypothetical protein EOO38_07620, partial [Cytophagaceae bacterium]